ncbi:MAG: hypothetical protein KC418_21080, partial [Anaerolineales bacterium]|nr:hypothetical protein [Anaerolineales bacterium]
MKKRRKPEPGQGSVPKLDLAPKLNRPLSLRNPLDYARLLYWVFFFPQALRWYEEQLPPLPERLLERGNWRSWLAFFTTPTPQRRLLLHGQLLTLFTLLLWWLAAVGLSRLGVPLDMRYIAVGVAGSVAVGVAGSVA